MSIFSEFNRLIKPLFDKIINNAHEILSLEQIRNRLLPELMGWKDKGALMNVQEILSTFKELVHDFLPILKSNDDKPSREKALFCSYSTRGNTVVEILNYQEQEKFYAPIKYLLSLKIISSKYSETYIKNRIESLYHELLSDKDDVEDLIKEAIDSLLSSTSKKYQAWSGIENIQVLDDGEYRLIDSTIKTLKEERTPFYKEHLKILIKSEDKFELLDKPCIYTEVEAVDDRKAIEIASDKFTVSFNFLRLYFPIFKPSLKWYLFSQNNKPTAYNEKKNLSNLSGSGFLDQVDPDISKHNYNFLVDARIGKDNYELLVNKGIKELEKNTQITKVVKDCLYWFGLGLDEEHPSTRLLNFVTVLESSLKKKNETTELKRTVSERCAFLLYEEHDQRKEALKQLKKIYDLRSKVVHTGVLIDERDFASLAGDYSRRVLMKLIKMSEQLNGDFERFIDYIDDIKLGKIFPDQGWKK